MLLEALELLLKVNDSASGYNATCADTAKSENDVERWVEHLMFMNGDVEGLYERLGERNAHGALSSADPMHDVHTECPHLQEGRKSQAYESSRG